MSVAIIDYGAGNIQSLRFALERLGVAAKLTDQVDEIQQADRVIFPGVGEARSAMTKLQASGLDKLIPTLTQPVLGICLGMQLMCAHTEEGDTTGLGIFDTQVRRFGNQLKVPHMGWNTHSYRSDHSLWNGIPKNSFFYYVHSFYVPLNQKNNNIFSVESTTSYMVDFISSVSFKNCFAVQFHPEKSGNVGLQFIENFINWKGS